MAPGSASSCAVLRGSGGGSASGGAPAGLIGGTGTEGFGSAGPVAAGGSGAEGADGAAGAADIPPSDGCELRPVDGGSVASCCSTVAICARMAVRRSMSVLSWPADKLLARELTLMLSSELQATEPGIATTPSSRKRVCVLNCYPVL